MLVSLQVLQPIGALMLHDRYEMVPPALRALEALGPALEAHLQLLLPALVRLICPGAIDEG